MIQTNKCCRSKRYFSAGLLLLPLLFLTGCHKNASVQAAQHSSLLTHTQQEGALNIADHTRLIGIQTAIWQNHQISDADLDFWVNLLHRGPLKNDPMAWTGFHTLVLEDALGLKQLSSSQQAKMYDAVLPYVSDAAYTKDADPSDPQMTEKLRTGNEQNAIALLAQTHDPRALEVLAHIAQSSPYPKVRRQAQESHEKLAALLQ
jgi:hypothetical protein